MIAYTQRDTLGRETAITTLRLDLKGAENFPEWVFDLSNLQELHLFNARFGHVHFSAWPWPELEKLKLINCGLQEISLSVFLPLPISQLDLSENPGLAWPVQVLEKAPRLQSFNFSKNKLEATSLEALGSLNNLRSLYLSENELTRIPADVFRLTQLRVLEIDGNKIGSIPRGIEQVPQLDQLNASRNRIRKLPDNIGSLGALSQLQLSENRIGSLPAGIRDCLMLRRLDLRKNKLSKFPASLDQLPWLSDLDLSENKIGALPKSTETFKQLAKLDLHRNTISEFSLKVDHLPRLRELNLNRNELTTLPPLPPSLFSLSASSNQFRKIPESVLNLPDLKELFLERNKLEQLPPDFGNLTSSLIRLGLAGNPVKSEVEPLLSLRQLREISGLLSAAKRRDLLLAQQSARTLNLPDELSVPFFRLLRSAKTVLPTLNSEAILLALNHPIGKVAAGVRKYVQKEYGLPAKGHRLKKGHKLGVVGRTFFDKNQLQERLAALGIELLEDYDPAVCTHLLLGFPQLHQEIPPARQVIMNEKELVLRLDKLEKKPLLTEKSEARLGRLQQLLTSPDTTNVRLGFRMITGNGLPPRLWNELLVAYYLCERDPGLQLQIKHYIRLRLEDEGKNKFFAALTPQLIKWGKIKPEKEELLRRNRFDLGIVQGYLK
ncbi:leucine-rich repeat domain-containing protein [Flavilitoribacter nigricans]|uniref:Disease resistance R13L4/SHOC-2-like LRR domain-containing protein n=1 Tax=Flavilitoribacter nigricans (strain ATCC 23147 / DSM 23189 / NBRC 102662 / NCIMB 1420 / SS-2) TaxID=1122177 RepID=A0A2D0MXS8_FLAN2|nr:leucine-rich repeat domain-containing protein [Flavilitoribacter nigricans]PHN01082.1 hypothetical protein CRP01_39060 [Flavilitoribacter nigricans DSM 23189 = NBRC 102662]